MLDIKFIRENKDVVQAGASKKHVKINIDELITLDDKRKETLSSIERRAISLHLISLNILILFISSSGIDSVIFGINIYVISHI